MGLFVCPWLAGTVIRGEEDALPVSLPGPRVTRFCNIAIRKAVALGTNQESINSERQGGSSEGRLQDAEAQRATYQQPFSLLHVDIVKHIPREDSEKYIKGNIHTWFLSRTAVSFEKQANKWHWAETYQPGRW